MTASAAADPWQLDGMIALVTGATGGIGASIAERLAQRGATLALADLTPPEDRRGLAFRLQQLGAPAVSWHTLDVRQTRSCDAVVQEVMGAHGQLHVLVNSAGVTARHDAASTTDAEWDEVLDVNLSGTFRMCRAALQPLSAARAASIVNLGSTAGAIAITGSAAYGVSKAGVLHLTRVLALEWATHDIRVNAVAPTIVPTAMTADVRNDVDYMTAKLATIPLRRMAQPHDVANAVAFLASSAAAMTTGQVLFVDGGAAMR